MRFTTHRENRIERFYKENHIVNVFDLSIENLCKVFNLGIRYYPHRTRAIFDDDCGLMYLNNQKALEETRVDFFHELGHYFDHPSDQREAPKDLSRLMERQARHSALYAAMPRFLLEPYLETSITLTELHEDFKLPIPFIRERIRIFNQQNRTNYQYKQLKIREEERINKSLQKEKVYKSTLDILKQLKSQVGEENISYEIKNLLR